MSLYPTSINLIKLLSQMADIRNLFSTATKASKYGVEGYHVDNKYFDARRSREQKILATSKDKSLTFKPAISSNKTTFIDDIQKKQGKRPGPATYEPKDYLQKSRTSLKVDGQSPTRVTVFDEIQKQQKKRNYPAAGKYDKVQVVLHKSKLKSDMSKAEVCNYIEGSMRKSIQVPGVGDYTAKIQLFDHRGISKWKPKSHRDKSVSERGIKAPQACTYNPRPLAYDLFGDVPPMQIKKQSHFNRQQRFKSSRDKPIPFYNILSQWGMKDKLHKKDILSRVGSSLTHNSVYY